jgi:hypothetical protein
MLGKSRTYQHGCGADSVQVNVPVGRLSIYVWACLILMTVSCASYADEWSMTPSIQIRDQYDDNIYLSAGSPISVWGGSVSPLLDIERRTAASAFGVGGRLIFNRYSEDTVRDTNIQLLTFTGRSDARNSRFRLTGFYKRDTTITTATVERDDEQDGDGASDAGDVDANLVEVQARRSQLSLGPSWTYALNRVTSIRLGYSLNDTTYSNDAGTSLVDYRRQGVNVGLTRVLAQRDLLNVAANVDYYEAPDKGTETDNYGISAGLRHDFSPMLRGEIALGVQSVATTRNNEEIESIGSSFNVSLVKKYTELTTYRFSLERGLYPSGAGTLVLSDRFQALLSHDLSPRLIFSVRANAYSNQSLALEGNAAMEY